MALNEACAKLEEVVNAYIFRKNEENNLKLREELVNFINRNDTVYTSVRILKKVRKKTTAIWHPLFCKLYNSPTYLTRTGR